MNLSLSIIKEKLGSIVTDFNVENSCTLLHLPRPVFYSGESILNSDTLYMSTAELLPASITFMKGSALICISTPPMEYYNNQLDLLVIDDNENIFSLCNDIHNIYNFFESWDLDLQHIIREHGSLQYILDISEHIFQNGMSIMNPDYYIVALSSLLLSLDEDEDTQIDEFGRLNINQVNSFKNDEIYQKIKDERNAFIYPENILPYRTLCKNIFLNDEFIFRIVIFENIHEFTDNDIQLLEYLTKYLIDDSEYLVTINQIENIQLVSLIQDIILGKPYSDFNFNDELKKKGWFQKELYCIAYILPSSQDIYNSTLTYFCNKIMHDFKHTFALTKDDNIIVIMNLDHIGETLEEYLAKFSWFIREGNFRVGFSNHFTGLNNLKDYFQEACIALETGTKHKPTIWTHKFCDCVFDYILDKIVEDLPSAYLKSPILTRLYDYDNINNTEYVKTLETYLKNNMNALQTAKDLHIHRATIVYRLERIKEIGVTDLKNSDDMLHLHLSIRL